MKPVSFFAAAVLALAAGPALADAPSANFQPDWHAARDAFRDGAKGNFTPTTPDQKLKCAAYWLAWRSEIGTPLVPPVVLRGLDDAMGAAAAKAEIAGLVKGIPQTDANGSALVRAGDEAKTHFVVGAGGDRKAWHDFFARLGACRLRQGKAG